MRPIQLGESGPHGDAGVEQSPRPVAPTTEVWPVDGSIASRLPAKPRLSRELPGPGTNPSPTSGGRPGPIGRKAPLRKSTAPNSNPIVIAYTMRLASPREELPAVRGSWLKEDPCRPAKRDGCCATASVVNRLPTKTEVRVVFI